VVISGISVVKHCKAPLNGATEIAGNISLVEIVGIGFNLDSAFPVAEVDDAGDLSGAFFARHAISLGDGQTQTLGLSVRTGRHFCRFSFQVRVDPPAGRGYGNVTDHGRPFSVTAELEPGSASPSNYYLWPPEFPWGRPAGSGSGGRAVGRSAPAHSTRSRVPSSNW
jgi:hypothetical protein